MKTVVESLLGRRMWLAVNVDDRVPDAGFLGNLAGYLHADVCSEDVAAAWRDSEDDFEIEVAADPVNRCDIVRVLDFRLDQGDDPLHVLGTDLGVAVLLVGWWIGQFSLRTSYVDITILF